MKRKNIILNIATIALCICAIVVGVYSAKSASLSVGGTVGFKAHNCEVELVGKITGATAIESSDTPVDYYITATQSSAPKTESETIKVGGTNGSSSAYFGNLYFTHNSDADANDIVMTFTITNKSAFDIKATLSKDGLTLATGVTAVVTNNDAEISANGTAEITLTISVTSDSDLASAVTGALSFTFEKYVSILSYDATYGWHIKMGKVTTSTLGVAENTQLIWVPVIEVAEDGTESAFDCMNNKPETGHTYYFLSYNILPVVYGSTKNNYMTFNFYESSSPYYSWYYDGSTMVKHTDSSGANINPNDYSVSNIRAYLNGNTAYRYYDSSKDSYTPDTTQELTSFLTLYGLTDDPIYTSLSLIRI